MRTVKSIDEPQKRAVLLISKLPFSEVHLFLSGPSISMDKKMLAHRPKNAVAPNKMTCT
jgi:hypothetical protein